MKFVPVLLLLAFFQNAYAQTKVPGFGEFNKAEKEMTVCAFDPEAEAVIIFDKAEANHNDGYNLITKRRIRMKILKEKGLRFGNVNLYFYSKDDFESLYDIHAVVFNQMPDGSEETKELATENIFTSQINDKWSEKKFALPGVRVGSIIEYEYTTLAKNYNGLRDWFFQTEMPTMLSSFDVVILPNYEFAYKVSKAPALPIVV